MSNTESLIRDLLESNGLKKTPIRIEILQTFLDKDYALSAKDLMGLLKIGLDRVTLYRALNSFENNGILHRASEDQFGVKYAICNDQCPNELHSDHHAHFICESCQQTYCLESVQTPDVKLKEGFMVDRVSFTMSGTCKYCVS